MSAEQLQSLLNALDSNAALQESLRTSTLDVLTWATEQGFAITREDIELEDYRRKTLGGQNQSPWSLIADHCW